MFRNACVLLIAIFSLAAVPLRLSSQAAAVPAGQTKEKFFNENYEQLAPTPAYRWFQYSMVLSVQAEKPLPSFKQTLQSPIYP
jgi:hypothetical protein